MNEELREMLAEEQGLTWCSWQNAYISCDGDCDNCDVNIKFEALFYEDFKG